MDEGTKTSNSGCIQVAAGAAMLGWLALIPAGVTFVSDAVLEGVAGPSVVAAVAIVATAALLLPALAVVALLARRRAGWQPTAALAASAAAVAGYLLLDATVQAVLPEGDGPSLRGEGVWAGVLRLGILVPYALLVAWLAPRLAGAPNRPLWSWLGLDRLDLPTLLLALAIAVLVTVPWPVTGALGDRLTSLSIAFQALARVVPRALVLWGAIFCLLTSTFPRTWLAALTVTLLHSAYVIGGALPDADWARLGNGILLLPLALLLTELRARESGIYPLLPVALCYAAVPSLFVDPRDAIAQGIPEPQHITSHLIVLVMTALLGPLLWGERRLLLALRDRVSVPNWARHLATATAAMLVCCAWGGLYLFAGKPGFYDDGFLIILEEQADLEAAYATADREERLWIVYDALVETATRTQAPLRAELNGLGVPYRSYHIINMIRVDGHRWLMRQFEGRAGVAQVILNPNVREYPARIPLPYGGDYTGAEPVQPNLAAIGADEAWALEVTGQGIVVAGQDTGYEWTHPALKPHYRGWDGQSAEHSYNWHDSWDDAAVPFDDDSHGTHTMGIVLGDDGAGNRTGVAPDARWIGCRNMRRGFGNPGSYAECMEFFLAPYPHSGDPFSEGDVGLAPHVVNNSWGCPDIEGCFPDTLELAVEALRAAGVMMVVSVGNEGPACETATTPPANYDAVFSVGATDEGGYIVGFSSRGPVGDLVKPDIAAPGDSVRSSVPGGDYGYAGGTSMAGPHVAGAVALLWSADPDLIGDIGATERLLCETAASRPVETVCTLEDQVPEGLLAPVLYNPICACGGVIGVPNNVYGCGFLNAGEAVRAALGQ